MQKRHGGKLSASSAPSAAPRSLRITTETTAVLKSATTFCGDEDVRLSGLSEPCLWGCSSSRIVCFGSSRLRRNSFVPCRVPATQTEISRFSVQRSLDLWRQLACVLCTMGQGPRFNALPEGVCLALRVFCVRTPASFP